jgi:probable F420-dependent oxidoreductase
MNFGLGCVCTDESMDPREVAGLVEEMGLFDSLFFGEHTHIPASRTSPFPGGELPRDHCRAFDPFVALTAAAGATSRILLGTGACLLVERDPIICAKEVASLDRISGGRTVLTVGAGWNMEEMENHGTDPRTRFTVLRERVEAIRAIWTQEEASYHGQFVNFDRIWSWPKPVQVPHPPVLLGIAGPKAEERVLAYGDGWGPFFPNDSGAAERVARFVSLARDQGRELPVTIFFFGLVDARTLEAFAKAGAGRCVFWLTSARPEVVEQELLGEIRRSIRDFTGSESPASRLAGAAT